MDQHAEVDESTQDGPEGSKDVGTATTMPGAASGTTDDHTVKSGSSGGASSGGISATMKAAVVPSSSRVGSYNHPSVTSDSSFFAQKAAKHGSSMKTEEAKSGSLINKHPSFGGSGGLIHER